VTTETTVSVDALDASIDAANPDLGHEEQRLAVAVFRLLATGQPQGVGALASAIGLPEEWVDRTLRSWPTVFRDEPGEVIGFAGLTVAEMPPHRMRHEGVDLYAWCAWDPMFVARIIGDLDVATQDPVTGELITYGITRDGTIFDASHPEAVLSFLRPGQRWDGDVITSFCHFVLQFAGSDSARRWTADHPGTFIISVDDALELGRRHATRAFGTALT
jgi:alkylmercury lyase